MSRVIENLSPDDQARASECFQQGQFAFVQLAELFRRGAVGLELTGEEYATLELLQKIAGMFSSGLFPGKQQVSHATALRAAQQLMGSDS